jgi:dopamine D1-like receptor
MHLNSFLLHNNQTISHFEFDLISSSSESPTDSSIPPEEILNINLNSISLFFLLTFFSLFTIFGNVLVILSVLREHTLHSPTHYFIASLATADFLLGSFVMPVEAISELLNKRWIFGSFFCDFWRALDVLLATASILNLCVISLDRYWAISSPFSYPRKMTPKTSLKLIFIVWLTSTLLSFPFIFYWKYKREDTTNIEDKCTFTSDPLYLIGSSLLSFYIPLSVMLYFYYEIYRAAVKQTKNIKLGCKMLSQEKVNESELVEVKYLRIHRGGSIPSGSANIVNGTLLTNEKPSKWPFRKKGNKLKASTNEDSNKTTIRSTEDDSGTTSLGLANLMSTVNTLAVMPAIKLNVTNKNNNSSSATRGSLLKKKLAKFAKEKKAAKTLAIVLGVFILCWLPFFVLNLMAGICPNCGFHESVIFNVFTWLGWVNSGMNPVIYAARNPDFRR